MLGYQYRWLAGGYDLSIGHPSLEVAIMVVTWWIVTFLRSNIFLVHCGISQGNCFNETLFIKKDFCATNRTTAVLDWEDLNRVTVFTLEGVELSLCNSYHCTITNSVARGNIVLKGLFVFILASFCTNFEVL